MSVAAMEERLVGCAELAEEITRFDGSGCSATVLGYGFHFVAVRTLLQSNGMARLS